MTAPRIMAEAQRRGITLELLPDGKLELASIGKPPAHIITSAIEGAGATFSA